MVHQSDSNLDRERANMLAAVATSIRRERERANLSASELARRAGLAKSTLSQLEAGGGNPSMETLWSLAVALGVPVSRLIEPPRQSVEIIRADEGPQVHSEQADYTARLLSTCPPGARRDLFVVHLQPGVPHISDPHLPGTREHIVLCSGRARMGPVDTAAELGVGDYITYPADVRHLYEALAPETSAIMLVEVS